MLRDLGERIRANLSNVALMLILLAALALRVTGIRFGLPYVYHPDEPAIIGPVRVIMQTGDFNPHWFHWPSFYIYVQLMAASARYFFGVAKGQFEGVAGMAMQHFYPAGRLTTALLGVTTVFLVFLVGKKAFNRSVGVLAALLLAVSFLHVRDSHYITVDVPATFFILLSFFFSLLIFLEGKAKNYVLAGLFAGLATATKYNAVLILVALLAAHFLGRQRPYLNRNLAMGVLSSASGFFIGSPYALLDLPNFLNGVAFDIRHYSAGHPGFEGERNWQFYLAYLFREGVGPGITISGIGGLALVFVKRNVKLLLMSLFPLTYFILLSGYRVRFVRNIIPVIPFLCLLGAYFLWEAFEWLKGKARLSTIMRYSLSGILLLAVVAVPFVRSTQFDLGSVSVPTRTLAAGWIRENIPQGSRLVVSEYAPPLGDEYAVSQVSMLGGSAESIEGYDYLIFSSGDYQRFFRDPVRYSAEVRRYKELFAKGELVKSFEGDSRVEEFLSPTIRIYRTK